MEEWPKRLGAMDNGNLGVHVGHCCIWHGCKYGYDDCPVAFGEAKQDHVCETCGVHYGLHTLEEMHKRHRIETVSQELKLRALNTGRSELWLKASVGELDADEQLMLD